MLLLRLNVAELHIVIKTTVLLETTLQIADPTTSVWASQDRLSVTLLCLLYPGWSLWFYVALIIDIALVCLSAPASDLLTWASM